MLIKNGEDRWKTFKSLQARRLEMKKRRPRNCTIAGLGARAPNPDICRVLVRNLRERGGQGKL